MTLDGGFGQINTMKGPFLQTVDVFTAQLDGWGPIKYTTAVLGVLGGCVYCEKCVGWWLDEQV